MINVCNGLLPHPVKSHADVYQAKGWLRPYLLAYDELLWKRWHYWGELKAKGTAEDAPPIPQIDFLMTPNPFTQNMLMSCINGISRYTSNAVDQFADWLLWGLGDPNTETIDHIDSRVNEHFYKEFDLFFVLDYPTDYLSWVLADYESKSSRSGRGYFPTPFHIAQLMTKLDLGQDDPEHAKYRTVMDSCVGCGSLILPASNYTLRGYGTDINATAIKLCKVQMHWYAPWYADPQPQLFEFLGENGSEVVEVNK